MLPVTALPVAMGLITALLALALQLPRPWASSSPTSPAPANPTYWLTRMVLLRATGLIYLCGFATAAFQARPLFGSAGLMPLQTSSENGGNYNFPRPTPAFDLLEHMAGLPFCDCALELVSWTGVALSLQLLLVRLVV
eukprot:SAG31_NODE_288_length_18400_cov_55.018851_9_plen_138_part_00